MAWLMGIMLLRNTPAAVASEPIEIVAEMN
jgi:hypothetical protein